MHHNKRKKGVTFSPEPVKLPQVQAAAASESSEDELNGYSKVVVSQNLADEILEEIYGKIEPVVAADHSGIYENSVVSENGAIEAPFHLHEQHAANKSLADEILDELYGGRPSQIMPDNSYEEISHHDRSSSKKAKPDFEHSPVITGKIIF